MNMRYKAVLCVISNMDRAVGVVELADLPGDCAG